MEKLLLLNPKEMTDNELWRVILNIFPEKAPQNIKEWYNKVNKEFHSRNIKLRAII